MINISTGGFYNITGYEACLELYKNGINSFELSGGKYDPDLIQNIKKLTQQFSVNIHNYFPPPKKPFVLNLATKDEEIAKLSFDHIKKSIILAAEINSNFYSFHSGFLINPKPTELGKKISRRTPENRTDAMDIFIERVNSLAIYARDYGVELLIENNVVSANNFNEFQEDVFLMTNSPECEYFFMNTPDNVNMLLDVAHLKVSSRTLNFSAKNFINTCNKYIKGYHLSDNNGLRDSNEKIKIDSWFWKFIKKNLNYYTIEVYNIPFKEYKKQYQILEDFLSKK